MGKSRLIQPRKTLIVYMVTIEMEKCCLIYAKSTFAISTDTKLNACRKLERQLKLTYNLHLQLLPKPNYICEENCKKRMMDKSEHVCKPQLIRNQIKDCDIRNRDAREKNNYIIFFCKCSLFKLFFGQPTS